MEMLVFLPKIYAILQQGQSFLAFAENEIINILQDIGDIQHRAALAAMEDAKQSKNKEREYASAITLLRSTYEIYVSAAGKRRLLGLLEANNLDKIELYRKASQVATLCAVAYWILDEPELTSKYSQLAQDAFEGYAQSTEKFEATNHRLRKSGTWTGVWMTVFAEESYEQVKARLNNERQLLNTLIRTVNRAEISNKYPTRDFL